MVVGLTHHGRRKDREKAHTTYKDKVLAMYEMDPQTYRLLAGLAIFACGLVLGWAAGTCPTWVFDRRRFMRRLWERLR